MTVSVASGLRRTGTRLKMIATEVITIITALTTLVTAIGVAIVAVKQAGMKKAVTDTQAVAEKTEKLVNSRMDGMMRLLETYRDALQLGGVTIPPDDSIPPKRTDA